MEAIVLTPEERIEQEIDKLTWLRQAVEADKRKKTSDVHQRVTNLTEITGRLAQLERQLYLIRHLEVDSYV